MNLEPVANSFRLFFKLLETLVAFWSSRDHHLKVSFFNNLYITSQYYADLVTFGGHLANWLKSNTANLRQSPPSGGCELVSNFNLVFHWPVFARLRHGAEVGLRSYRG